MRVVAGGGNFYDPGILKSGVGDILLCRIDNFFIIPQFMN